MLLPTVLSMAVVLGAFGYLGTSLTVFNVMGFMLVLGVGVNYAIFLCGPGGYMSAVKTLLADTAYQNIALYQEDFSPSTSPATSTDSPTPSVTADVGVPAPGFSLSVPAFGHQGHIGTDETLLAALEREGLPIIGACRSGVCGSCKCKLEQGEVESGPQLALSAEQIAEGYVLACASTPRSNLQVTLG